MKIHALHIENFRGFEMLDVTFHPSMTVLIGENGAGKTALLEALAVALGALFRSIPGETGRSLRLTDARHRIYEHAGMLDLQPQGPVRVAARGRLDGQPVRWVRSMRVDDSPPEFYRTRSSLRPISARLAAAVKAGEPRDLPVVGYYGAERLGVWRYKKIDPKRGIGSRFDGYMDALDPTPNHRLLAEWIYQQTLIELQSGSPVLQLRAIERAVRQCIEGTTRFFFDVKSHELMLERASGERLPFSFLSDGYRNMVALVADVAWRAAVLNPHLAEEAAEKSEGVVLIDEVDLHLHPRWQRRVLGDLRRTFPNIQFVVTTHSPQVIASAHRDEVRVFDNNKLVPIQPFVEGRDTNSLLEDVFGVPERPEKEQREIDELSRVLDEERYEEGRAMLARLEQRLGPDDPAVIRARWILEREAPEPGVG
ncbi:AAA family ATPase [Polyangium fumosum]|uniref:DUF2813 domain-containing protein n=1 Tax=Polyangium fumosum TaxID=889272 RepID=A0A4U1JCL9_9BACT|nr:AAA family ATPase [Polyangium fumosum]TKD08379.1 DUF2813 domain-containing protein [Polyangium fumosum]